jgi:transposase InsO family protein
MNDKELLTKELTRPVIKKFKRRPVITTYNNDIWGADLLDVSKMKKPNKNITFLLIIIDIYSRFAFCVPLKNKSGEEVLNGFKSIKVYPKNLWVDEGKEFYNSEMKKYCKEHNINMYHTYSGLKSVFAERFNKTLRDLIYTYLENNDTNNYIDGLHKIIDNYNNNYHNSIKETPYNIYVKGKEPKRKIYMTDEEPRLKVDDYVRKVQVKKLFEKGYTAKWSEEIYSVSSVDDNQLPIMYELKGVKGKFYYNQLLKSNFKEKTLSSIKVKNLEKEGKNLKKIAKEGLGEVILDKPKRIIIKNKKYI